MKEDYPSATGYPDDPGVAPDMPGDDVADYARGNWKCVTCGKVGTENSPQVIGEHGTYCSIMCKAANED